MKILTSITNFLKSRLAWILGIAVILLLLLNVKSCNENKSYKGQVAILDSLTLANQTKDSIINADGKTITIQEAIVVRQKDQLKALTDEVFNLKKKNTRKSDVVTVYVKETTDVDIDSILAGYTDTLKFKKFSDSVTKQCQEVIKYMEDSTLAVPRKFEDSTQYFSVNGSVTKDGVVIKNVYIPDTIHTRVVEHKGGLLKRDSKGKRHLILKKYIEIQTFHTNPYIKTTGLNSVIYKPQSKGGLLKSILLIGAGILIHQQTTK
jgi:hypothetical protein